MNYENMTALSIIKSLKNSTLEDRNNVLNSKEVINKFRNELLMDCCRGDIYRNYRDIFDVIDVDYFFKVFDYPAIHNSFRILDYKDFPNYKEYKENKDKIKLEEINKKIDDSRNRNANQYKLFVVLCEKDLNKTVEYILKDDNLFKEFFKKADDMYSCFATLDYDLIVNIIMKLERFDSYFNGSGYEFISCIGSDKQKRLLDENFSDDFIMKLLGYFHPSVVSYFFSEDKRALYLYKKVPNLINYVNSGVKFNKEIVASNDFFNRLKSNSFVEFRRNINAAEKYNDAILIEDRLDKYYKELINQYDSNTGMFKIYSSILNNPSKIADYYNYSYLLDSDVWGLFRRHRDYDDNGDIIFKEKEELIKELKKETNNKLSEIIIDALFSDNIYNVWLNIKEMLRFNNKLDKKVLDEDKQSFYNTILNFDKVSCEDKIKLFYKLKDKNINMLFYQDLRKLKDLSYDLIKKDLVDLDKCQDKIDKENTNKYKQRIYDLRDSKYTMLVRVQTKYNEKSFNRRNCYSIISNENTNTYGYSEISGMFMYGYNSFENDRVIHMLEQDAFSSDSYSNNEVSKYVNRIATSRELTNGSSWYSEVEIVNLQNEDGKYTAKKPDFIVCYEEIGDVDIEEAERLNIPIVIIRKTKLEKENQVDLAFDREKDIYSNNSYDERIHKNTR